mgnify:CR=1 FL=1
MLRCSGGSVRAVRGHQAVADADLAAGRLRGSRRSAAASWSCRSRKARAGRPAARDRSATRHHRPPQAIQTAWSGRANQPDANQCLPVASAADLASALGIPVSTKMPARGKASGAYTFAEPFDRGFRFRPCHAGMPSAFSPTSITPSVPRIIGALTWPIWAMRNAWPCELADARRRAPRRISRCSRRAARTGS